MFGFAQEENFSQFYSRNLYVNPALTGSMSSNIRVHSHVKNQWQGIVPYRTMAVASDATLLWKRENLSHLGVGALFCRDKAGDSELGYTKIGAMLAYHVHTGTNNFLSAGFACTFKQSSINYANLDWNSQFTGYGYADSQSSVVEGYNVKSSNVDYALGIQWHYNMSNTLSWSRGTMAAQTGVALFNVNEINPDFNTELGHMKVPVRYIIHSTVQISRKDALTSFLPSVKIERAGKQSTVVLGGSIRKIFGLISEYTGANKGMALQVGCYNRLSDALVVCMGMEYASFALDLSYDITTSQLTPANYGRGGFEVSVSWQNLNPFFSQKPSMKLGKVK